MKANDFPRRVTHILLISFGILGAVAVFYILAACGIGIPCLFRTVTGFLCPGCGNSRAAISLLKLDIPAALEYNPLFPLEFFYIAWVYILCCKNYLQGKRFSYQPPFPVMDILILIAVAAWWILRNIIR